MIWAIPGVFGFLAWELKENWKLYRANRSCTLKPLRIGHHGETVRQLLRPGVHSGTLRKVYRQGRRLYGTPFSSCSPGQLARWQRQRQQVSEAVLRFVERNLVFALERCSRWHGPLPEVEDVFLSVTAVEIHLAARTPQAGEGANHSLAPAVLRLSCQAGWIVAEWRQFGWLANLPPNAQRIVQHALLGLYQWAGVDILAEPLRHALHSQYFWQLDWYGLRLYRRDDPQQQAYYPWQESGQIVPQNCSPAYWPSFHAEAIWFNLYSFSWELWQAGWHDPNLAPPELVALYERLLPGHPLRAPMD
ncbi:hypothetical protein HRbin36_02390 [bacterium HR36]|nr:hypothetical protein HRbin36_02390 [bacterium HR36]